jgi:CRISPR-associated endonuclease/helicase Cas3
VNALSPDRFDEFFRALYGENVSPFPWQRRLVARVANVSPDAPGWPQALALPTASGKTSCLDIAVFALACQAKLPPLQRSAPRRIFFIVDRRVIVDSSLAKLVITYLESGQ